MIHDQQMSRRAAITMFGAAGVAALAGAAEQGKPPVVFGLMPRQLGWDEEKGGFVLPDLPYAPDALEPHIDAATMEIHHGRHHASYVAGLNRALAALKAARESGDFGLVKHWSREVSFHGAGHINHALFWAMMAPAGKGGGGSPGGRLAETMARDFGSFEGFAAHFRAAAVQVEGSGWAWLVHDPISRRLMVIQGEKQQDMMVTGVVPLLGIDVWEHAYYLRYQNRRADYVAAFMNVVNWPYVQALFEGLPV